ncbi:Indole-3-acetic acid-amido synthetase GH3.17 [Hibiscus syriacus]|uniref:Indole-3-acetic acid-amido synthetase GH3.17 n=1 Tax=Hibiscus syriacus TaxID=106335 RepID=A0A6A3CMG3_HIBSY|nr:indole-3-acetic acid-amido synthetase GH3.17-like [Hibiscus syriacus]XP_039035633.1 indole-3-acetic acid-amido synthetase GH3.17-like [Hibiscus syriacus]XP_039035639.1 indole-3-acetic acid-amido synthetase GH3.17-like [Hibiscus syriacus]KAE8730313.1 Indole-3-acetic acid-amido synthetase GH3.17 [Hibiscus syriacus]
MSRGNPCQLPDYDPNDNEAGMKIIEDLTENVHQIQQLVLEEIITRNAHTEYLKGFLNGQCDMQVFKNKVPVVNYEDIKPYIERIANGDSVNIISAEPIIELLTSSGTSGGQPKMMPSTAEDLNRKTFFYNLLVPVMNKYVDGLDEGKAMYLLFVKPETKTPSGLMARPVLTSYYKSSNFKNRPFNRFNVYTSPDETILCSDGKQSMYCQLLCGLVQRQEVLRVGAVFASAFLRAIKFLEDNWKELCSNIRAGHVSDWITDPSCRNVVSSILGEPDPESANLIEHECGGESWEGIIKKLWPRTKYIEVIVTGSMAQYVSTLEFYSGGIPLVSTMYASSECYFGINFKPLSKPSDVSYTLISNMAYFEFIPVKKNHEDGTVDVQCNGVCKENCSEDVETVDLVDVKLGQYYELVVTTFTGLYRYRVGDILMVSGFHNKAPQFRFVHRRNVVLSIDTDKTNEEDLLKAVTKAKVIVESLGFLLIEYTSYADTTSIPGHYVLFWELTIKGSNHLPVLDPKLMEQCCSAVEESLDSVYRRCRRKDNSIGPLEIRVVQHGTFDALMDFCVSQGSSVNQYKTPRCIKSEEVVNILDSRVVGRFFSPNAPSWKPVQIGD